MLDSDGMTPIYIQIAEWMENEILNGTFSVDEKVHSQYTLAEMFNINPATAAKGLKMLSDENILYTKRGLGKFVTKDAKQIILDKRRNETLTRLVRDVVVEARQLQVSEEELIDLIRSMTQQIEGERE
ncbi:GntR family transcriptional regulator [Cerasibacillus sp.]|uniref:GntR family transcriptional regulator n=1 Tax=Cerasibacillus sp. TaxID=2498711 RepID=UPI0039C8B8D8